MHRSAWPCALFLIWATLAVPALSVTAETSDPCAVPKSLTRIRPDSDGSPIPVRVGVLLIDLVDVDELQESFNRPDVGVVGKVASPAPDPLEGSFEDFVVGEVGEGRALRVGWGTETNRR